MLSLLESVESCSKNLFGTAPRSEGGRRKAALPNYQKQPSQCHGDHLSCHSNLCYSWCLSVYACVVVLIKGKRLAPSSEIIIMVIAPQKRHFPEDSTEASTSFPCNITLLLIPGWEQLSSSPWRRCFLPLCWCFNNLHSNVISKLASIVSSGLLCAMKLNSILGKSPVVWEPVPAKVIRWKKNKGTEITVALQPWMPYQLGNNRERLRGKKKNGATVYLAKSWGGNYMRALS